jgi:hypothetical protein
MLFKVYPAKRFTLRNEEKLLLRSFTTEKEQSFMAFRKPHDSSFIWFTDCIVRISAFLLRAIISFERSKETKQKKSPAEES